MSEKREIQLTQRGLALTNLEDMFRFAQYVVASGLAPAGLSQPEQVVIALQSGAELGMPPMASLRGFGVINGRATLYGDAGLALVRKSGKLEAFDESIEGNIGLDLTKTSDAVHAKCSATRDGRTVTRSFSVEDAKRARLWMKKTSKGYDTPWVTHPQRMMQFKARAFCLRDLFGDVLEGLSFYEEFVGMEETEPTNEDRIKADMGSKKVESVTVVDKPKASDGRVIDDLKVSGIDNGTVTGETFDSQTDPVEELAEIIEAATSDEPDWL